MPYSLLCIGGKPALQIADLLVIVVAAFAPSLIYLIWMRNSERFQREPYGRLLRVFFIGGALVSVLVAIVFESLLLDLLNQNVQRVYQLFGENPNTTNLILACVIAPLVEELAKSYGVFRVRRFMRELEDGLIYGAAAGLGFAATENLFYESDAFLTNGAEAFIATAVVRTLSSALLHASASSVFGLGIARGALEGKSWLPYYFAAVIMHALFNLAASMGAIFEGNFGDSAYLFGLSAAFVIAIVGITTVRAKIRVLDRRG
jgi:RsiW-degrading membrane proteinase PrsW (M82 family)